MVIGVPGCPLAPSSPYENKILYIIHRYFLTLVWKVRSILFSINSENQFMPILLKLPVAMCDYVHVVLLWKSSIYIVLLSKKVIVVVKPLYPCHRHYFHCPTMKVK